MDNPKLEEIKDDILSLDLDQITPVEALIKLNEIKRIFKFLNKLLFYFFVLHLHSNLRK